MDNLVKLQIINLFKKYDYVISEFEMKNEISNMSQQIFKENIRKILVELKSDTTEDYNISDKTEEDGENYIYNSTNKNEWILQNIEKENKKFKKYLRKDELEEILKSRNIKLRII